VHEARARAERDTRRAAEEWLAAARAALDSRDGREAALTLLDRAVETRPDLVAALDLRARLRAEAGRSEEALADCEACISLVGEPPDRLALHLRAAAICQDGLNAPARALPHLASALADVPDGAEALARLVRACEALGRPAEAAAALRRLVDAPGLPRAALVGHLVALARAEEALGDRPAAIAACRRALAVEPAHDEALRLMLRLEGTSDDPWVQVSALETAARASRDPRLRADAHAKAARLLAGLLGGRGKAIEHLRAALALDPERDEERAALAELLEEVAPAAAVDEHRALIARDPLRIASWAALYRHFERTRAHDRAYVAATIVRWLGAPPHGPATERLLLEGDRQALPPPPPLGAEAWDLLRAPGDRGPLADVVALAGDAVAAALGAPRGTRGEPLRPDHPYRLVLAELAKPLELPPYELFGAVPGRLEVEPGPVYAVRIGTDLARRTTAREQRFLLGRVAARLRSRSCLAELLPPSALTAWALAAARAAAGGPDDDLARQVAKGLGRRSRKALEPAARALLAARPPPDPAEYRAAAARTADRVGLLLCGDVPTALDLLLREGGAKVPDRTEAAAAVAGRADVRALLAFAASDVHFVLRQRLRVAIA
jgi:tetratricopeptide (TPR) repeat protein